MSQISRTYKASSKAELKAIYDDWATTYDKELAEVGQDYVGPAVASAYVLKTQGGDRLDENLKILDAGCGTGLAGVELAKLGARNIDGVDLSPGMLDVAKSTGAYKSLEPVDLSVPLARENGSYDIVICVGTLTEGHVGPDALDEFIRVLRSGGYVVATILETIWESVGFEKRVKELVSSGKAKFLSADLEDYRRGVGVQARVLVLQAV